MPSTTNVNFADELLNLIRTEYRNLQIRELLRLSPHALLGVSPEAAGVLKALEVNTVFDLATSGVFDAATKLIQAGTDILSALNQHGSPTADLVREAEAAGKKVGELQFLPVGVLESIPLERVDDVQHVLDVQTVRDLALYPPYLAALKLLTAVYFPENVPGYDSEQPADLIPKTGEYPTERVQYTTLLMDEIQTNKGENMIPITGSGFKPIDLAKLAAGGTGFKKVAFGALLTINQSWYAQGVTLGQLLHSTSLAPGESTRVAVIDWSRRSRAGETEAIDENDDLTNDTAHNRSISEVTQAVANEAQGGFSHADSNSQSNQAGTSSAAEMSAPLGGLFGGPSGAVGHSSSSATTSASADGYSTSYGHRDIGSTMLQNVNDRTHQHAHSSRSRRASVVKEVSQTEHEGVSTRVLANYNHMHALTVQYYEVIQIYRVEAAIAKADRVVFIPLELIDFKNDAMIRGFKHVLERNALTYTIREALRNLDVLEISPHRETYYGGLQGRDLGYFQKSTGLRLEDARARILEQNVQAVLLQADGAPSGTDAPNEAPAQGSRINRPSEDAPPVQDARWYATAPLMQRINDYLWTSDQAARLSGLLDLAVLRADSLAMYLPTDVTIENGTVSYGEDALQIAFHTRQGTTVRTVGPSRPLPMSDVSRIGITGSNKNASMSVQVILTLNRNGVRFPLELPPVTIAKGASYETTVVQIKAGGVNTNLKKHFSDNQMHYSQAIFRSLDSSQIAWLLSGYGVEANGRLVPVSQVVEPRPIRYVGNYLAFKMNTDLSSDEAWASWMREHGIQLGSAVEDIVPLPSGGTFAEAILGRSNCAEKLDITRFWNWQDSPIPLQPTQIADIQTGSRAISEDIQPGQLSNPIINITSPAGLPDPSGTAAILAAIQNGGMFRDMSGLQGTIGLAQAALQATAAGAATAGEQAGSNMNNLLKANTERQRIAAEMITSLAKTAASMYTGSPAGGGGISGGNHSQDGAKINYFDKNHGQSPSGGGTNGGAIVPDGGSGNAGNAGSAAGGGGSNGSGNPGGFGGGSSGGEGYSRNPAALAATWGDSQSRSSLMDQIIDKASNGLGVGSESPESPLTARKAWPKLDSNQVLTRIHDLADNANLFNQGAIGLCTTAVFYHHIIQKEPQEFTSFANALYGAGIGFLGALKVSPDYDLRNADYASLAAQSTNFPPQADWMLMASIRDSENWFFDYEGAADESTAMRTSAKELSEWYISTKFYSSVEYDDFTDGASLEDIESILKTPSNQIVLWIRTALLQEGDGSHVISLEGPIAIDEPNDKITFDYWTWGQPVKTGEFKISDFKANLWGAITARY